MTMTTEQVQAIEEMIARRMENTGETRDETCDHLANYFQHRIELKTTDAN